MLVTDPHRADWKTAAETFGHSDRIGGDSRFFKGKKVAGPPDSALNFVEKQQEVVFIAKFADALHEFGGCRMNSAFALNRFKNNRGRLFVNQCFKAGQIVEVGVNESWKKWSEAAVDPFLIGCGHSAERAAMKRFSGRDDFKALPLFSGFLQAVTACEFEKSLIGFKPAVAKEDFPRPGFLDQDAGDAALKFVAVEVRCVRERGGLLCNLLHPKGMRVTDGVHADTAAEIEIFLSGVIADVNSVAFDERQRCFGIISQYKFFVQFFGILGNHRSVMWRIFKYLGGPCNIM